MYTTKNFRTKKELVEAVQLYNTTIAQLAEDGKQPLDVERPMRVTHPVTLYAPGLGSPVDNGWDTVEGPHYPQPHKWYARVLVVNGIVVQVK